MKVSEMFPSKYLKAGDLQGKEVLVTIESLELLEFQNDGGKENKWVISLVGKDKAFICNVTNATRIEYATGEEDNKNWPGKQIILRSEKVDFKGKLVDSIRVKIEQLSPPAQAHAAQPPEQPIEPLATPPDEPPQEDISF